MERALTVKTIIVLQKIISGGQTGIDRMALEVAKKLGVPTGGTAPKEYRTENGPDPSLAGFGLIESPFYTYDARTKQNVLDSDATILYGNTHSVGSRLTIYYCKRFGKPHFCNPTVDQFEDFILLHNITILNVAGNRRSSLTASNYERLESLFYESLQKIIQK